jgi:glutathione synthase/RimK-type ligase-like ATP-grasp enzyme
LLALANPESERVARLQEALSRLGRAPASVLAWREFLPDPTSLERHRADALRIESPGEDALVERMLIAKGADEPDADFAAPRLARRDALALDDDRGRILFPRQRYLGFRAALREIEALGLPAMNAPRDIATMGDKPSCHRALTAAGVPRPRVVGTPRSFDELVDCMRREGCPRVFVKLANGSSGSGVAAYCSDGRRHIVDTTVERVAGEGHEGPALYNSTRVRRLTDESEVRALFDALCQEGVIVEQWIPKAGIGGHVFDLRVVVIAGRACHTVVRTSPTSITNLHLGRANRRGDLDAARERLGDGAWSAALDVAERSLRPFPSSFYAGVDVLVTARGRAYVAEVNAFGDLLRRERHEGRDTYEAELRTFAGAPA